MKCKFCGEETELFFCPNCGKIIEYPQFIKDNAKLEKELAEYVQSLVQEAQDKKIEVQQFVDKGSIAKVMFRKYYEHCLYLQELCANKKVAKTFASNGVSLFEMMMGFAQKCNTNECQIAVVGTVKAGKSMFINAILGREVASSYPTPETASLTKFRYSPDGDYVKVSFYSDREWKSLWEDVKKAAERSYRDEDDKDDFMSKYEELKADELRPSLLNKEEMVIRPDNFEDLKSTVAKYTSCKYPEHFFAKEVEVGLSVFNVPKNVVFVDTPGLNDPVEYRVNISRKHINSANVVLLCISADKAAIESTELAQTATIFSALRYAKERIYVFGTKIDFHTKYMDYWEQYTKPVFVKELSKKYLFGSEEIANERIFPVTALFYNLIQRAKLNSSIWDEDTVDKHELNRLVLECLGNPSTDFLLAKQRELGLEKGAEAIQPKARFYPAIPELEEKTNIPNIVAMLNDGPIKNAEQIIKDDIVQMYLSIFNDLIARVNGTSNKRLDEIHQSSESDIEIKISKLEAIIKEEEKNNPVKIKVINEILNSLKQVTDNFFMNIKNK